MRFAPQLAKLPSKTQAANFDPAGYIVERKWDGMRAIFEIDTEAGETRIFSRTGQDLCPQFPELCDLHERVFISCVLDGEIVALCPERPDTEDLERLQLRLGDKQARRRDEIAVEIRFFDILAFSDAQGERDVRDRPIELRRELLEELFVGTEFSMPELLPTGAETPAHWEGTIAKRRGSRYVSGGRNADWLKFKFTQRGTFRATELTPGKGARAGSFGAVKFADAAGVHRGQVGSGFTEATIRQLMEAFAAGERPLIEVEYRFLSKTGLCVNTAFKGLRTDKMEADVL